MREAYAGDMVFLPHAVRHSLSWLRGLAFGLFAAGALAADPSLTLRACGGQDEWPPSSYFKREGGTKTGHITGFSPDVLTRVFSGSPYKIEFALIPWGRCLAEVASGKTFQIAMGGTYNVERARQYRFSKPYLWLTPSYFFLPSVWKSAPAIRDRDDLLQYKLCGFLNYNYASLGLSVDDIDTGSNSLDAMMGRLKLRRCDMLIEYAEVVAGFIRLGRFDAEPEPPAGRPVPGADMVALYFMLSPKADQANRILALINLRLTELGNAGELSKMLAVHAPR